MNGGVPLLRVKLVILFNFIKDGFRIIVGYVLVNDFDVILREEILVFAVSIAFFGLHHKKSNYLKRISPFIIFKTPQPNTSEIIIQLIIPSYNSFLIDHNISSSQGRWVILFLSCLVFLLHR